MDLGPSKRMVGKSFTYLWEVKFGNSINEISRGETMFKGNLSGTY